MVGILCNKYKFKKYEEYFSILFKKYIKKTDVEFIIFTMADLDINSGFVWGSKICESGIEYGSERIPDIIFNFSVQYKRDNINKLRILQQIEGIRLINEVNRFDQLNILEMLDSSNITRKYLLDYKEVSFKNIIDIDSKNSYIFIPRKGADLSKLFLISLAGLDIDINCNGKCLEIENKNLNRKLYKITGLNQGIMFNVEKEIISPRELFIVRVYLQRGEEGIWNIIIRRMDFRGRNQAFILNRNLEEASLNIAKCIGNYIPSMATCFIDFAINSKGKPYFIHLGGWSKMLLDNKYNNTLNKKFSYNLMKFIKYSNELERRLNDVG